MFGVCEVERMLGRAIEVGDLVGYYNLVDVSFFMFLRWVKLDESIGFSFGVCGVLFRVK